ncbi:MAG: hypothetical protein PVI59_13360 [Anaerolineae bacterium]|jgi:hypothetical protein
MPVPIQYASFLIRLWREGVAEGQDRTTGWHSEIERIQTGERWEFRTLDQLLTFLRRQARDLGAI